VRSCVAAGCINTPLPGVDDGQFAGKDTKEFDPVFLVVYAVPVVVPLVSRRNVGVKYLPADRLVNTFWKSATSFFTCEYVSAVF
jgi:hypothetical protein